MKQLITFLFAFLPLLITAQTEGKVIYNETVKFEIDLPEDQEHMRDMIPSEQTAQKVLYFTSKESLYKDFDVAEDGDGEVIEHASEDGGMQIKMVIARPEYRAYRNLESEESVTYQEFFGRKFLIKGSGKKLAWKMAGEQKKIDNYLCMKATYQDSTRSLEAWFTPQIPVSIGPGYGDLPGLILEVNINDGERKIVASKVDLSPIEDGTIEVPSKGKEVTREEFEKIQKEKMKEMEEEMGGSGMHIKIRH